MTADRSPVSGESPEDRMRRLNREWANRPPVSGEPRQLLANAPERVQRCTTHHACDCHQWMVARWWEASTGAALDEYENMADYEEHMAALGDPDIEARDRPPVSGEPTCPKCGVIWTDTGYYEDGQRCHDPRPPVSGEPHWECGATDGERPGYVCGRPAGHKGMHRRRTEASTGAALDVRTELADACEGLMQHVRVGEGPLGDDPAAKAMRRAFDAIAAARLAEQEESA